MKSKLNSSFLISGSFFFLSFFLGCSQVTSLPESVSRVSSLSNVDPLKSPASQSAQEIEANQKAGKELEEIFLTIEKKIDEEETNSFENSEKKKEATLHAKKNQDRSIESAMPVEMNEQVKKWIFFFTVRDRERFGRFLERGQLYQDLVSETLARHGLPSELYYLAMIESGYQSHAVSKAAAVGVWQFIQGTAHRYGLKVNHYVDERRDPIRATDAAVRYLRDLNNAFQSWYLAMASYNAGENRILSAILRGQSRNFWELSQKKLLPLETREYVPKFLAAVIIGRHPEKFGFDSIQKPKMPIIKAVEVPERVRLSDIALLADIPLEELEKINPHLIQGMTPPGTKTYEIWAPESSKKGIQKVFPRLAKLQIPLQGHNSRVLASAKNTKIQKVKSKPLKRVKQAQKRHFVRQGDSLSSISKHYNVRMESLRKKNSLKKDAIYAGQMLEIPLH